MKAYKLFETGMTYLREALADGDQLAHEMLKLPLESGEIFTFLPDEVQPDQASLQDGFISDSEPETDESPLLKLTTSYLSSIESTFIVELNSITSGDAEKIDSQPAFSTFLVRNSVRSSRTDQESKSESNMAVYGFVDSSEWTRGMIRELLLDRWPFGAIGCITTATSEACKAQNMTIELSFIAEIVDRTRTIIAFAFDDEGWICWTRDYENPYINNIRLHAEPAVIRLV